MRTKIVEVTQDQAAGFNWGKMMVGEFTPEEWNTGSVIGDHRSLLAARGWGPNHRLVLDLETGEGALFSFPIGSASADLNKHRVWVCPMFEPLLAELQRMRWSGDLDELPDVIELPNAPEAMAGYRRPGRDESIRDRLLTTMHTYMDEAARGTMHDSYVHRKDWDGLIDALIPQIEEATP